MNETPIHLIHCYNEYSIPSIIHEEASGDPSLTSKLYKKGISEWKYKYGTPNQRTRIAIEKSTSRQRLMIYMTPFENSTLLKFKSSRFIEINTINSKEKYLIKRPYYFFAFKTETQSSNNGFSIHIDQSNRYEETLDELEGIKMVKVKSLEVELKWNQFLSIVNHIFNTLSRKDLLPPVRISITDVLIHFFDTKPFVIYSALIHLASNITGKDEVEIDTIIKQNRLLVSQNLSGLTIGQIRIIKKGSSGYRSEHMPVVNSKLNIYNEIEKEITIYENHTDFSTLLEILIRQGEFRPFYKNRSKEIDIGIVFCSPSGKHIYGLNLDVKNGILMDHFSFPMFITKNMIKELVSFIAEKLE